MFTRRSMMIAGAAALAGCAAGPGLASPVDRTLVRREGMRFTIGGEAYHYAGTNMWYGAYLGADAAYGNRPRLARELDRLAALGITNIRALAGSEDSPLRNSVKPSFRDRGSDYNQALLGGLDHFLAEMGRRGMRAVLYLTNFWEWSGGMATYLYWNNGGRFIDMNDPAHPWPEFPDFVAGFYWSPEAVAMYHDYIRAVVGRINTVTGIAYADDPTIMAWQLANEPRPGGSEAIGRPNLPAFYRWVEGTAALIKSLDPNHLVSTGSEGLKGCLEDAQCVITEHSPDSIDYLTAHIWPQNWGWADPQDLAGSWPRCEALVRDYIVRHVALAEQLGKPLVIEEFGFPRDGVSYDPAAATSFRDRYYGLIYEAVEASVARGGPLAGSNFWSWNGEGRAQHEDWRFRNGDISYLGDPPHEPQGWYGVFDGDESTQRLIRGHVRAIGAAPAQT
ncbi:glycoside hydrolase 5 family protein [Sphingosinicella terrae]|uniref:glycoside hydrolase 5 family protein n=1 Tax=Sphingosinicella terrae TaxID=2172047 RepID=UPI000E0D4A75|nr:cellulase family glycosylhydrolase [Sphingosinicella terrae]